MWRRPLTTQHLTRGQPRCGVEAGGIMDEGDDDDDHRRSDRTHTHTLTEAGGRRAGDMLRTRGPFMRCTVRRRRATCNSARASGRIGAGGRELDFLPNPVYILPNRDVPVSRNKRWWSAVRNNTGSPG